MNEFNDIEAMCTYCGWDGYDYQVEEDVCPNCGCTVITYDDNTMTLDELYEENWNGYDDKDYE